MATHTRTRTGRRRPASRPAPVTAARLASQVGALEHLVHVTAAALLRALEAGVAHGAHGLGPFLVALRLGLAPFMASIPGGRRRMRPPVPGVEPGVCALCGCTDAVACAGGCDWANADHTICTRCEAELAELRGRGARDGLTPIGEEIGRLERLAATEARGARACRHIYERPRPGEPFACVRCGLVQPGQGLAGRLAGKAPGARQGRAPGRTTPRSPAAPVVAPGVARPGGKASRPAPSTRSSKASSSSSSAVPSRKRGRA